MFQIDLGALADAVAAYDKVLKAMDTTKDEYENIIKGMDGIWKGEGQETFQTSATANLKQYEYVKSQITNMKSLLQSTIQQECSNLMNKANSLPSVVAGGPSTASGRTSKGTLKMDSRSIESLVTQISNVTGSQSFIQESLALNGLAAAGDSSLPMNFGMTSDKMGISLQPEVGQLQKKRLNEFQRLDALKSALTSFQSGVETLDKDAASKLDSRTQSQYKGITAQSYHADSITAKSMNWERAKYLLSLSVAEMTDAEKKEYAALVKYLTSEKRSIEDIEKAANHLLDAEGRISPQAKELVLAMRLEVIRRIDQDENISGKVLARIGALEAIANDEGEKIKGPIRITRSIAEDEAVSINVDYKIARTVFTGKAILNKDIDRNITVKYGRGNDGDRIASEIKNSLIQGIAGFSASEDIPPEIVQEIFTSVLGEMGSVAGSAASLASSIMEDIETGRQIDKAVKVDDIAPVIDQFNLDYVGVNANDDVDKYIGSIYPSVHTQDRIDKLNKALANFDGLKEFRDCFKKEKILKNPKGALEKMDELDEALIDNNIELDNNKKGVKEYAKIENLLNGDKIKQGK